MTDDMFPNLFTTINTPGQHQLLMHPSRPPVSVTFPIGSLTPGSLDTIRQIVREEMDAALQRLMIGEQRLLADVTEPQDEQEELAAVLATMTAEEWETLVQRVRERKAKE